MSAVELTLRITSQTTGARTTIASSAAAVRTKARRMDPIPSVAALTLQQVRIDDDEGEADQRDDESNRGSDTRLEIGKGLLVDKHAHWLGGAEGAAARHHPDDVEYLHGVDRPQHQRDHQRSRNMRKGYGGKATERAGPVDMGRVVQVLRRR